MCKMQRSLDIKKQQWTNEWKRKEERMAEASRSSKDGSAKTAIEDQITQTILSTSNLLRLMLQSSPAQAELMKLPRSLLAKSATVKNTELTLEQMPRVISSLDAHIDNGLQSVPQLRTAMQLLSNIESSQLKPLKAQLADEVPEMVKKPGKTG